MDVAAGCPKGYVYEHGHNCQEPREFTQHFANMELKPQAVERIAELRGLFPHDTGP